LIDRWGVSLILLLAAVVQIYSCRSHLTNHTFDQSTYQNKDRSVFNETKKIFGADAAFATLSKIQCTCEAE
jgi:hypothetical protein